MLPWVVAVPRASPNVREFDSKRVKHPFSIEISEGELSSQIREGEVHCLDEKDCGVISSNACGKNTLWSVRTLVFLSSKVQLWCCEHFIEHGKYLNIS